MKASFSNILVCAALSIFVSQSSAFAFNYGDTVQSTVNGLNIHSSDTLSSSVIDHANAGDQGTVYGGPYYDSASSYYFYYVGWFTHSWGYSVQNYLQLVSSPPSAPVLTSPGNSTSPGPVLTL